MAKQDAQVVIVTGAASGIGHACAAQLLAAGKHVVGFDLQTSAAASELESKGMLMVQGDVSKAQDCELVAATAMERFGRLDGLAHWAAVHSTKTWQELDAEHLNKILAVNVTGSLLLAQAAANCMIKAGRGGSIVLTGSTSTLHAPIGGQAGNGGPAYVASKAAITGVVRSLAKGMGPFGIRVNGVAPGVTQTPMISNYSQENYELQARLCPLGRLGTPDDVASMGVFLLSDAAQYVSGEMIIVNGAAIFG